MSRQRIGLSPLWIVSALLLVFNVTPVAITQGAGDADPDGPIDVTLALRDGNGVQCKLLTPAVTIDTDYGSLSVPTGDVIVIYHALRTDGESEARIKELIKELGHDVFEKREEAGKQLVQIGKPAVPALQEATKSDDAEVAERAAKALEQIKEVGGGDAPEGDTVVAKSFTMVGRITLKEYEVESAFGKMKLDVSKVDRLSVRPISVPAMLVPAKITTVEASEVKNWRCSLQEEVGWTSATFNDAEWVLPKVDRHYGFLGHPQQEIGVIGFFRRTFLLDSPISKATLAFQSEAYEAYVNGISVGRGSENSHEITGVLKRGVNVIAVRSKSSATGYDHAVSVTIEIE